ncbi:uncharacterized protein Dwil_GK25828 [Drosophila willistoni]|uniref:Uncharacterized protein n=1 Tax=Drosophila willistoni TaxID=7260 RepID=B4NCB5_DROWI|nr:uncharacterized protein LOC6648269 [Drosophila willistoni]EDW82474.1 uncharacterized protein Dwil_GK25828 [Drosophila willistoni]
MKEHFRKRQERYEFKPAGSEASEELINVSNQNGDSLAKLAYNLYRLSKDDHIVIDRKRNEVIRTDAVTNQMTIYRCRDPISMGMRQPEMESKHNPVPKVGRPQKRPSTTQTISQTNGSAKLVKLEEDTEPSGAKDVDSLVRTRSGRLVRPSMPQPSLISVASAPEPSSAQMLEALVSELRDTDYRVPVSAALKKQSVPVKKDIATPPPARSVPVDAICPGCNKIFLGRRMQRHFVKFPDHMPRSQEPQQQVFSNPPVAQPSLFGLLTAQLQRHSHLSEEQRADLFLHELTDFVEQLQLRSTRLIRNTSGLHFVNARISRVLGIPEGQYALDMSAMESPQAPTPEPEQLQLLQNGQGTHGNQNLVDYTGLSMSLDDTLTDEAAQRLNLSVGGKLLPPSEESLLRNVGDLMQPPVPVVMAAPPTVVGNGYDHASDNAVEALSMKETPNNGAILDLNVEFFQFNQN